MVNKLEHHDNVRSLCSEALRKLEVFVLKAHRPGHPLSHQASILKCTHSVSPVSHVKLIVFMNELVKRIVSLE